MSIFSAVPKILRAVFDKISKKPSFLTTFFLILKKLRFFLKKYALSHFLSGIAPKFIQKSRKVLRVDSDKEMLLANGLTDNTKFIGPFPSRV